MMATIAFSLNGKEVRLDVDDPQMPLLYALRDDIGLHGPRFGCGLGQCGACTVHVEGRAVRSCITPVANISGKRVVTLEGLTRGGKLHAVQQAFVEEQAAQCGYCINGMIMQAAALLEQTPHPTETQIKEGLKNNLCRCGTHVRIVRAVQRAAAKA